MYARVLSSSAQQDALSLLWFWLYLHSCVYGCISATPWLFYLQQWTLLKGEKKEKKKKTSQSTAQIRRQVQMSDVDLIISSKIIVKLMVLNSMVL